MFSDKRGQKGLFQILFLALFCVFDFRGGNFGVRQNLDSKNVEMYFQKFLQIKNYHPGFSGKSLCNPSLEPCVDRRETSPFADPTPLRYDVRSGYYTGQRDYAARLRCVPSVRQTTRTHSADQLCLIPRRQAARRAALRPRDSPTHSP
jgi:hypothetical protein